ncbi:MAG: xanthine dehydrogenase accessory protein XdhC, partial [Mangrovicoccus sp.]|nr:xanthine dehydrogenase accessory protein XdhC [Mangrovicoccus sp.]
MSLDLRQLEQIIAQHGPVIRVVVAETRGSTPRETGASMLVWANSQAGTIGGGALELAAAQAARAQLAQGAQARVSRHPLGPDLGQCCGGAVSLVSEHWDAAKLQTLGTSPFYSRRISGEAEPPLALRAALKSARNQGTGLPLHFSNGWLAEPIAQPQRQIWIHGAGHVGRALVAILAPLPDLAITWVDTGRARFPENVPQDVTMLPAADPARLIAHAPAMAEHFVMTYSHALDLSLCDQLLRHGFRRAGLIGSATKWARFQSRLNALGHAPHRIARITCPIGDPRLGKAPQHIAIGVAQQILAQGMPCPATDSAPGAASDR